MRKSLLILAALIAFGGISAQAQGPKDKKEHKKELREKKERKEAPGEYTFFGKSKNGAAKDGGDSRLTVIPNGTLQFTLKGCGTTQTRPLVIKNNSDERVSGVFQFTENGAPLYSDIQLGDYVYGNYSSSWNNREILNYFEVNGYAYAYNYNYNAIVRTNLTTGSSFRVYCPSGSYRSLAYDGKTFWAANNSGNIYALDADLNPTGKKIVMGYSVLVVWNGTELLTFERNNYPSRVKSFDANGNLKADYGYVNCYFYYAVNYNPVTGLFWASDDNSVITVFNFENGKLTIKNGFSYYGVVPGFDADGNPYVMLRDDYKVYKTKQFSHSPKGIEMSQIFYDIEPYGQTTINITATTELGTRTVYIRNYDETFSTLQIDVDAKPEYSLSAESMQFATVAGFGAEIQTLWLKNTGCSPVGLPDEPTIDGDAFVISDLVLPYESFSGLLNIGDSIGVKVGCGSANAGTFDGTLTWNVTDGEAIELPLTATVAAANSFTISESATATIDCGAGTATIVANIANNSNMKMFVANTQQHVVFDIHIVSYGDEVFWYLRDSENNIIKSVETETYNSDNTVYTEEIDLPAGEYTIELYDDNWDGWDGGGYMNVIVDGKTVLEGIRPEEYSYTTTFKVQHNTLALLAEGESISQLTMPLNSLNIGGTTEILIGVEGVIEPLGSLSVTTPFGEPELTVDETIDFGYQIIDPENPNLYGTQTLTIANTGCGPLLISSLAIGDDDDFMFWDEDTEEMVHTLSNISIEPNSTFEKTIYFAPSAAEECTGTLTINTGTDAATTVQLKGTGIGVPVAEYAYYYDSENRLGFKPDTIDCSQSSTTLKGRIANSGTGPLVVSEPIRIEYQAGNRNNQYFKIYDTYGNYYNDYSYSDNDYSYYFNPGEIGSIRAYGYGCDGKIIISNGKKTLHTINLADIAMSAMFEFAATETDTIAPGDTLELEMTVMPDGIGENSFYYYLTTNDPDNKNIEMNGKVRVVNAPKLVFPEVIDFGEISVGSEAWQYVTYEDEGCGNFNFENFWVTNTENPLTNDWGEVGFVPTAAGTFTNTLKVATYYYTVGSEQVKDTFEITLKGTAVESPTAVFSTANIPATVDYDKKVASATTTVTNTGTSTALKLWKGNDTIVVEPGASVEIKLETSVKGKSVASEYDIPFTYYTNDAAHPSITFYIAFPINEIFEYDFNKDSVEFATVHTGITSYSSITLRNRGTLNVNNGDEIWFKEESNSKFNYYEVTNSAAYIDDSITYYFEFRSDEAGTFRDTLYIKHGTRKTDSIPFVATAKNTSVISVSTPFANRYAVANDTIAINVTFDGTVVVVEDDELELMPQMKMNTGGFAVLDSTALLDSRDDLYTLTFLYAVQKNDNVALFDYAEDSVYMNKHVMAVDDSELCDSIALPAVGTMPKEFPVTIDNKAPQLASADLSQDGMSLDVTIKFSEPVIGFDEKCVKLTGATLNSLKTKDNQTFTASITLQNCVDIEIGIKADLKDAAGNTKKVSESKSIPAIHNYTTSVVAPTCTEAGYTLATCNLCKHEEKSDEIAATGHKPGEPTIEVKVPATETAEGKCDTVIVCTVCGAELSRHEGTIPATGNGGNNGGNGSAIADGEAATSIYAVDLTVVVEVAEADGAEISVVDMNGRVVAKAQANSTRTEIALPTAGVYVVSVGQTTEKVVLQ